MRSLILAIVLSLFASAEAGVHTNVLATFWNEAIPHEKEVEIKNVDLIETDMFHMGTRTLSYHLAVYIWSKRDLGATANTLMIEDALHRGPSFAPAVFMGVDPANQYYVYQVRRSFDRTGDAKLYAHLKTTSSDHYSNEESPNQFFEVHF